ncbi:hypothetical protein [Chitinophaga sp. RAB17]|uniref:hypothetical protein n=1 Tax=Chitinophaga sp. RAB17 TaxID=3233049 RepID=UPI003F8EBBB4
MVYSFIEEILLQLHYLQHNPFPDIPRSYTCDRYDGEAYDAYNDGEVCILALVDAAALVALADASDAMALVVPADVENVPAAEASVAAVDVAACVEQKDCHYPLSTSLKLKTKTSSWHFFFVSYNR